MVVSLHIKLVFSAEFNNTELTEYHDFTKLMFSSKIIDNSNTKPKIHANIEQKESKDENYYKDD